jgi:hypothetical protein
LDSKLGIKVIAETKRAQINEEASQQCRCEIGPQRNHHHHRIDRQSSKAIKQQLKRTNTFFLTVLAGRSVRERE